MIELSFEQVIFYSAYLSLIPLIIISSYRIIKKQYHAVILRNIAGFLIGMLDQILMIWFGWQAIIIPIVILFNYGLYGIWFLIMPIWDKINRKKIWIPVWVIFSGVFNTILENAVRIYTYGDLNYPAGWNQIHTLVFYLSMHALGTLISSLCTITKNISYKQKL